MKKEIHPEIHQITAHCACGNALRTSSTASELNVTICSACHPFFTGQQKFVDTAGRIERFEKRYSKDVNKDSKETSKKKKKEISKK